MVQLGKARLVLTPHLTIGGTYFFCTDHPDCKISTLYLHDALPIWEGCPCSTPAAPATSSRPTSIASRAREAIDVGRDEVAGAAGVEHGHPSQIGRASCR